MKISELTAAQYQKYFETRLQGKIRKSGASNMACCPFHSERVPSFSINFEKGVWHCHGACNVGGGILDFEKRFLGGDDRDALARIGEILGEQQISMSGGKPERVYDYQDAYGKVLFQKLRYPGKKFVQRKVIDAKEGKYEYKLGSIEKPLYHFPEILVSDQIFICEGEKDCDNVRAQFPWSERQKVTATTNFDGAGKWRDEYGPLFMAKRVAIFADNDEAGEKHAEMVARCVHRYTPNVKLIRFPELPAKGDVSDFLQANGEKGACALIERLKATPLWKPPEQTTAYFMPASKFALLAPKQVDWIIRGLIARGTNGEIISRPKVGKSLTILDLAIALASGQDWLGFDVLQVCRVGVVSREDWSQSTSWRLSRLCEGRGIVLEDLDSNLYVNTKMQVPKLLLDDDADMKELMRQIEARQLDFLVFDVLRKMHTKDENSNTEMELIIDRLNAIQSKTGAQILLIHHTNKGQDLTLTEQSRGAGVIAGWAEYVMGLNVVDEAREFRTLEMKFETKAGRTPKPRYFEIVDVHDSECSTPDDCACPRRVELRTDYTPEQSNGHSRRRRSDKNGEH